MTAPLYTYDCRNGHHGRLCGMTPCSCVCHANERSESTCLCIGYDRRDCAAAEPCDPPPTQLVATGGDVQRAIELLDGPFARPSDEYTEHERAAIQRVAEGLVAERAPFLTLANELDEHPSATFSAWAIAQRLRELI